MKVNASGCF